MAWSKEKERAYGREYIRQWRIKNPERSKKIADKYKKNHRGKVLQRMRDWRLKKYGITQEEYNMMSDKQNGRCAICGLPPHRRTLAVDHDHKTGKVRGLLCHYCNPGLGNFRDNVALLDSAKAYLEAA